MEICNRGVFVTVFTTDKLTKARSRCQTLVAVLSSQLRCLNEPTALEALSPRVLSGLNNGSIMERFYLIKLKESVKKVWLQAEMLVAYIFWGTWNFKVSFFEKTET